MELDNQTIMYRLLRAAEETVDEYRKLNTRLLILVSILVGWVAVIAGTLLGIAISISHLVPRG